MNLQTNTGRGYHRGSLMEMKCTSTYVTLLNEVSSVQISSMVLVVLMILSVTQPSLSLPLYTPCKPTVCISVKNLN